MRARAPLLAALLLAGCGQAQSPAAENAATVALPAADSAAPAEARAAGGAPAAEPAAAPAPSAPMLAYRYDFRIAAPPKGVRALVAKHEAACAAAGPAICQVTSSQVAAEGEGDVRATLSLRAEPGWLRRFREGLNRQAEDAGGEVLSSGANSEDLTRQIVDTEAALRAKSTLRDRLQALLAERPGKLPELLELERALAEVQGEIDATQSGLAVMRTRVATSALQIDYVSTGIAGQPNAWSPLASAVGDIGGMLAGSLGVLVRVVVIALPWAAIAAGLWFVFRRRLFKRRGKPPAVQDSA